MFIIAILWVAFFIINFNLAMMIPLLPFIARQLSLPPASGGIILAAFPIVALISNLTIGPFIDRYGRKRFIIAGALGAGMMLVLTALSNNTVSIALGRAATGLFMPMIGASIFAAIADYVPSIARNRVSGYVTSAAPIAFLFSLTMGIVLGGFFSWQIPLAGLAAVCIALAAVACTLPATHSDDMTTAPITRAVYRERLLSLSLDSGMRLLLISYFFWAIGVYIFLGFYPSWLVQHGLSNLKVETIGVVVFIGEAGGLAGALFAGRIAALFNSALTACMLSSFGIALIVLTIPFGYQQPIYQAISYMIFAFGRDLMLALILGNAMSLVAASQRGSLNASLNVIYQSGGSLGGLVSGWLYLGRTDFLANVIVSSIAFVLSALMLRGTIKRNFVVKKV